MKVQNTNQNSYSNSCNFKARMLNVGDKCYLPELLGCVKSINKDGFNYVLVLPSEMKKIPKEIDIKDALILFKKPEKALSHKGSLYDQVCDAVNKAKYSDGEVVNLII